MTFLASLQPSSTQGGPQEGEGRECWLLPGAKSTVQAWYQNLPLGMKLTAHRNVPEMEEAINMAHSDCAAWGGNSLIINLGVLIFDKASSR